MSKTEKLLKRFLSMPKDFTFQELSRLLKAFGYTEVATGKTAGSRVAFVNSRTGHIIRIHKPHPHKELKQYQLDFIIDALKQMEVIK
ncbi:MAG: type II toxin-antitoxin system HicA family toxin [Candidatus Wallbacteria bacterium]|nr:type II toxin-antitoxin system HicA family toxin [Candidatus Wallbacteria bacterium]